LDRPHTFILSEIIPNPFKIPYYYCAGRPVNSTVTAEEGGFVVLRCGIAGKDVEWTKNGESITSYDGEVWLFDVDSSDEGEYSCSLNSLTTNYLLLVQGIVTPCRQAGSH
jgi:hypothetical protein